MAGHNDNSTTCNEDDFLFNIEVLEGADPHMIIEYFNKLKESNDLYEKILYEKEKTIDLLKEMVSLMEERDKLKDERIDALTKKLMEKGIKDGISSESS